MNKQLLDKRDIAALVGRHPKTIEVWIREGFFPRGRYVMAVKCGPVKSSKLGSQPCPELCKRKTASAQACMTGRRSSKRSLLWYA